MKIKNLLKPVLLYLSFSILIGCSNDFLDEPAPFQSVKKDIIFGSRVGVETFISGIHRQAREQFTSQDTGGLYSIYFARSIKGDDLINSGGWWRFDYANENRETTFRRTEFSWNFPYYMINQTNALIEGISTSNLSEKDKTELSGHGKALRAFYYFQLALEFQAAYTEQNRDLPAPPINKKPTEDGNPMSTLGEMYDFIVSDLLDAIESLDDSRIGKSYINRNVANGILARVYLAMGNWSGAETAAKAAYGGNVAAVLSPETYGDGFKDIENVEWIWGLPQTVDQSSFFYAAPSSYMDPDDPSSYNNIFVNENFYNKFSTTDARNTFKIRNATNYRKVVSTKFKFGFDNDMVIMRTPEMILIEAEAKFRQNDAIGARQLLFALQQNRDPQAVAALNEGNALEEEILLERRKEMYGEYGVEWFDAKRLQRGIVRSENHRITLSNRPLQPNDKRFYLKIPQEEIDANPSIDESVNNGR